MTSNASNIIDPDQRHTQVVQVLEQIRPAIQSDGGDVELVSITEDGTVQIRLHGNCIGCPSRAMTLHSGIERSLMERVEGVTGIQEVD